MLTTKSDDVEGRTRAYRAINGEKCSEFWSSLKHSLY